MGNQSHSLAKANEAESSAIALEERGWLVRHQRGDPQAFADLVQAYQRSVYSFITRCGVDIASRDDLFQEIFLKLHTSAAAYKPKKPLRPWLFTIAANTIRNHFRSLNARPVATTQVGADADIHHPQPSLDQTLSTHQTLSWLQTAINDLPIIQRQVIVLITLEGLSQTDVSKILDMPLNTVKTHLRRARLQLVAARTARDTGKSTHE